MVYPSPSSYLPPSYRTPHKNTSCLSRSAFSPTCLSRSHGAENLITGPNVPCRGGHKGGTRSRSSARTK
ncbi:hypothetical protein E2C01_074574 [Portunus trituberculatus]|uniref:Uncharacterized protein n=1 Tax=Portunus trituberculatus TaxID=210409 RepID=A0A5B7I3M8_PORTR|nr:hypothetical protein [Portunus trituberculatus]